MRDKRKAKADLHRYLEALHNHITRFKQAKLGKSTEKAGESEEIFRVIFDNAADGILLADVESKKLYMGNKVICQMLGCNEDELKNLGVMDIHPEEHLSYVIEQFEKQMRGELTLAKDMPVIRKDGSVFYADINAFPITFGSKTYLMGIFRDITERKKVEEELHQSEERYRSVVNDSPGLICRFLPDGEITFVNAAYCEYFGKTTEELIGIKFTSLIPEEDRQAVLNNILSLTVDSPSMAHEHKAIASDGQVRWQRWTNRAIYNEQGRAVLFQSFGDDITERKRAEEALRESEEKYRTLVESAGDSIATIDKNGIFLFVNTTGAKNIGSKPQEVTGRTMWDFFPKEIADRQAATVREVIETGKGINEIELTELHGQMRWYNTILEPLKDGSGNVIAALLIARDVHNIKQAEDQIRKLSSAVEQSIDGIAIGDLKPKILYANDAYASMHGYTPEEMVGMDVLVLQSNEYKDQYKKSQHLIKTQGSWSGETEHLRKDGTEFPVYMSVTLLKDDKGQATGILAICRDITQYKKTQKDLMIKDAAIASSINAIAIGDVKGNLTYVNKSCLDMLGYSDQNEMLGKRIVEFCQSKEETLEVMETLQEKGGWIGELVAVRKDGSTFIAQVCATLIKDDSGRPISMMGSFIDITEYRRSQEQLNAYREKMARTEQLASLGTLSATLAHELTQPLTIIRLSLESAMEKLGTIPHPENFANKLKESLYQVSSMGAITDRFRNFARRSSEHIVGEVDLKAVAERIVTFLSESAKRVKVKLQLEDWDEMPLMYWNENDLEQLFFAPVNNAIQAADGKKPRWLIIRGLMKNQNIELQFSDNCGGISPDDLDRIFEPFFTTKPLGQGTGLGLCIVQDIVTRAGGRIRVESQYGDGSTFYVTLPVSEDRTSQLSRGK